MVIMKWSNVSTIYHACFGSSTIRRESWMDFKEIDRKSSFAELTVSILMERIRSVATLKQKDKVID
jgi:hypothetical protein